MSTDVTPKDLIPFHAVAASLCDQNPLDTGMPHDRALYPKRDEPQTKAPAKRFLGPESALVRALIHTLGSLAPANHIKMAVEGFCKEESVPKRHTDATLAYIDSVFLSDEEEDDEEDSATTVVYRTDPVVVSLDPEKTEDQLLSEFSWRLLHGNLKDSFLFHRETVTGRDILWVTTGVYNTHIDGYPVTVNWNGRDRGNQTINKSHRLVRDEAGNRVEQSASLAGYPESKVYMWALKYNVGDEYIFWVNHRKDGVSRDVKKIRVTLTDAGPVITSL